MSRLVLPTGTKGGLDSELKDHLLSWKLSSDWIFKIYDPIQPGLKLYFPVVSVRGRSKKKSNSFGVLRAHSTYHLLIKYRQF